MQCGGLLLLLCCGGWAPCRKSIKRFGQIDSDRQQCRENITGSGVTNNYKRVYARALYSSFVRERKPPKRYTPFVVIVVNVIQYNNVAENEMS